MISVDGLTVEFGGTTLFQDISFVINEKDRIALMGKNGAGKSTLLKILAGVRQPTRGSVSAPKDTVIAYLPQHLMTENSRTVFEETSQAFAHLFEMEAEINRMNDELATRTDYESESYYALIEQVAALSEKFYAIDLTHFEEDVEKILLGLGFERKDFNRPTEEFSGGWRMRIELAKLLLKKPDVLLLDEPTNHLDIGSREALEGALEQFDGTVIAVSHDRYFISKLATRVLDLGTKPALDFMGTYEQYKAHRARTAAASAESVAETVTEAKEQYLRAKEQASEQRKLKTRMKKNAEETAKLEAELEELTEKLADESIQSDYVKVNELYTRQSEVEERLMELYEEAESFGSSNI